MNTLDPNTKENLTFTSVIGILPNGGLNPDVVFKNVSAMYPNSLLKGRNELTVAVCKLYDLGMDYPDFIDSESLSSFFGGLSYMKLSGDSKRYDFIDDEFANVEYLVNVFTDPKYVETDKVDDMKKVIVAAVKAAISDSTKNKSFMTDLGEGLDMIVHEVVPVEIVDELRNTDTTNGAEFKKVKDSQTTPSRVKIINNDPMLQVSDSGYPVLDMISEYVAGSSGRGNDLFNNPDPGLKEKPITEKEYDSISKLTTPKVENIKSQWSSQSKTSDTIKSRNEALKLLEVMDSKK